VSASLFTKLSTAQPLHILTFDNCVNLILLILDSHTYYQRFICSVTLHRYICNSMQFTAKEEVRLVQYTA